MTHERENVQPASNLFKCLFKNIFYSNLDFFSLSHDLENWSVTEPSIHHTHKDYSQTQYFYKDFAAKNQIKENKKRYVYDHVHIKKEFSLEFTFPTHLSP